jgi:hypothetical protein
MRIMSPLFPAATVIAVSAAAAPASAATAQAPISARIVMAIGFPPSGMSMCPLGERTLTTSQPRVNAHSTPPRGNSTECQAAPWWPWRREQDT